MEKQQILTDQQREYMTVYAQRLAQLSEYATEIEAGDRKHEADVLDICTWMWKQGDNPAFLAGQIGEAIRPTTPESIAAQCPPPAYKEKPRFIPPTYDEIIKSGIDRTRHGIL